ncbi:MAG: DUF456 domain-containing protein [Candidatus Orphnella occulta]|nr:DUF456 domain-containing protein [Candidatus Orphnella occulta]
MEIAGLFILALFGLIGFAAIFFTTFGTLIIFIGAILYALMTGLSIIGIEALIILLILYLCGEVVEYLFVIVGAKKFGASNAATAGAVIGGIVGAIAGTGFLGIGLILGTFLGIFLGAFIVELLLHRDLVRSLKAGTGSVIGRVGSIVFKVFIAVAMFWIMITRIIA